MKCIIYSLSLLLCLPVAFSSCDDDKKYTDEEMLEKVQSHSPNCGFSGSIDGIYYKVSEAKGDTMYHMGGKIKDDGQFADENSPRFLVGDITKFPFATGDSLCIKQWPIMTGLWDLADRRYPEKNTMSSVWVVKDGKEYYPSVGRSEMILDVKKVLSFGFNYLSPLVLGSVYGTLYNTKDPNDSIVLGTIEFRIH